MAIVTLFDTLGFGATVDSATGAVLSGFTLQSDSNDAIIRETCNGVTTGGSFNDGAIRYTALSVYDRNMGLYELQSITYLNASGATLLTMKALDLPITLLGGMVLQNAFIGNDSFTGNRFADLIEAGTGNVTVIGNEGNDTLLGEDGADRLYGNVGLDQLSGGFGADLLFGGFGADRLTGGGGADSFVFTSTAETATVLAADVITDFQPGTDVIDLRAIDAFAPSKPNNAFTFRGTEAFSSATAGEIRYQIFDNPNSNDDYTLIYLDTDADSTAEAVIRLSRLYDLSAANFLL